MQLNDLTNNRFKTITFSQKRLINNSDSCFVICVGQYKIICDTFMRIYREPHFLLFNTDIHLNNNYYPLPENIFYSKNCYKMSLLNRSVNSVNKLCKNSFVKGIQLSDAGDLLIELSNNVVIELLIDVQIHDFIYYQIYHQRNLKMEKRFNDILMF